MIDFLTELRPEHPDLEFHAIGDQIFRPPGGEAWADDLERRLTTTDGVVWHGAVPRDEVIRLLSEGGIALSLWDYGHGSTMNDLVVSTKLLDYCLAGVPVILNRTAAQATILGADYPLFVSSPDEALPLIRRLLDDPTLYREAAERCRAAAEAFSYPRAYAGLAPYLEERPDAAAHLAARPKLDGSAARIGLPLPSGAAAVPTSALDAFRAARAVNNAAFLVIGVHAPSGSPDPDARGGSSAGVAGRAARRPRSVHRDPDGERSMELVADARHRPGSDRHGARCRVGSDRGRLGGQHGVVRSRSRGGGPVRHEREFGMTEPLRILHAARNPADQAGVVVRALRRLGHEAEVWVYDENPFHYAVDREIDIRSGDPQIFWRTFQEAIERFDIIHFHFGRSLFPDDWGGVPPLWDLPIYRILGKKVFVTWHGSDCRQMRVHLERNPWSYFKYSDIRPDDDRTAKVVEVFRTYADRQFVTAPDYLDYVPDAEVIGRVVDLTEWPEQAPDQREHPHLLHVPSRRGTKGTELLLPAVEQLKAEGLDFEFRLLEGVPHDQARRAIQDADVVVDNLITGDYELVSIEAMASSRVAVANIQTASARTFPDAPIYSLDPDNVVERLRALITDVELRRSLAARGRAHVAATHDAGVAAERLARGLPHRVEARRAPGVPGLGVARTGPPHRTRRAPSRPGTPARARLPPSARPVRRGPGRALRDGPPADADPPLPAAVARPVDPVAEAARRPMTGSRTVRRPFVLVTHSYYEEDPRVRRQAEAILASGRPVDVISLRRPGDESDGDVDGVRVRRLDVQRHQGAGLMTYLAEYLAFFVRVAWSLVRAQPRRRYALVQVATLPDWLVLAALPLRLVGVPVILDLHESMPDFFRSRFPRAGNPLVHRALLVAERVAIGASTHALTVNDALRDRLIHLGIAPDRISVVRNTPSLARFDIASYPVRAFMADGALRLVYAGALTPTYELDVAVRAVARLREIRPGLRVQLDVYGRGDSAATLEALAVELGVADRITLHGRIPLEDVPSVIAAADIGLAPTRRDDFTDSSFSTKILEYAAMRKPVVASRLPLVVAAFPAGAVATYTPGDAPDLVDRILALVDDSEGRAAAVDAASAVVSGMSWEHDAVDYLGLLDRFARGR